jgi:hypothetical protein
MDLFGVDFLTAVRGVLSHGGYYPEDFQFTEEAVDSFKVLTITYRYHQDFRFQAKVRTKEAVKDIGFPFPQRIETESLGTIHVFAIPGEILKNEHRVLDERSSLLSAVREWVKRIEAELRAIPLARKVAEQEEQLADLTAKFADMSDGFFSAAEAEELRSRLDAFEQRFAESIRQNTDDHEEADRRVDELHNEIVRLKEQLETLTRTGWSKRTLVRITGWLSDPMNRKLLKSGADLAKDLLLPPGQSP